MKKYLLSGLLAAGLASCGQTAVNNSAATATQTPGLDSAKILGFVKVTMTDQGNGRLDVSTQSVTPDGKGGFQAQDLSRPGNVAITTTTARGAFQDNSRRYMYTTLNVTNNGAPIKNLTLLAFNIPGYSLYDTSLTDATRQDGTKVTQDQARSIIPINTRMEDPATGSATVVNRKADFQLYSEGYIQNITNFFNTRYGAASTAFPYGFVARNSAAPLASRVIPTGSNTGQVSVAFAADDITPLNSNDDIRTFTFVGLITADANTTASADKFETSLQRACNEITAFGGSEVHGFSGQSASSCATNELQPKVRIAGDDAAGSTQAFISYP